ncbi:MAG: DUF167 domain-containing protein [Candidatus ainarchaeum sp.]|nr:DUF167 domain-containing protein [Candidatus ainarchaeum sp.]
MRLEAKVIPNAKKFSISMENGIAKIRVPAKAEGNEANLRLVKELGKRLGRKVALVRGRTSRNKVLEIEGETGEVFSGLLEIQKNER